MRSKVLLTFDNWTKVAIPLCVCIFDFFFCVYFPLYIYMYIYTLFTLVSSCVIRGYVLWGGGLGKCYVGGDGKGEKGEDEKY